MPHTIVPKTFAAWRHCIEVECGIALTPDFVRQRLAALGDPADFHTRQFVLRWGELHRQRVMTWFGQVQDELRAG